MPYLLAFDSLHSHQGAPVNSGHLMPLPCSKPSNGSRIDQSPRSSPQGLMLAANSCSPPPPLLADLAPATLASVPPFCTLGTLLPCDFIHVSLLPLLFSQHLHGQLPHFLCTFCSSIAFSVGSILTILLKLHTSLRTPSAPDSPYPLDIFFSHTPSHLLTHDFINLVIMSVVDCFLSPSRMQASQGQGLYSLL